MPRDGSHGAPEMTPLRVRSLLLIGSIVLGLLLVEGAIRVRQWVKYGRATGTVTALVTDPRTGLTIPRPGLNTGHIKIDSRGFRNPEIEMPKPPGRIRLAFLGASTTFCAEVSDNDSTWPSLVCRELRRRYPGVTFDYINAGVPGYDLDLIQKTLLLRVAPLNPDVIVFYEMTNNFSKDTRDLAQRNGLYAGKPESSSFLARYSVAWFLVEKNLIIRERQRRALTSPRLVYDADSLSRGFEARLVELLSACHRVAPVCAAATFSHKVRRSQPPEVQLQNCNTSLYYSPYMSAQGFLDGFDAYNRAIREAAATTGTILIGDEDSIPGDDRHFADSVHFRDAGARRMAERITAGLIPAPPFVALVDSTMSRRND
jgi:lysophospholipase L1-like esterase